MIYIAVGNPPFLNRGPNDAPRFAAYNLKR
jgi:hypothetical protein